MAKRLTVYTLEAKLQCDTEDPSIDQARNTEVILHLSLHRQSHLEDS